MSIIIDATDLEDDPVWLQEMDIGFTTFKKTRAQTDNDGDPMTEPTETNQNPEIPGPSRPLTKSQTGYEKFVNGGMAWPPYSPDFNPCDFFCGASLRTEFIQQDQRTKQNSKKP